MERQESSPELRQDLFTERAVWYIPGRIGRPSDWVPRAQPEEGEEPGRGCPFCPGHEEETPPEVWALRPEGDANTPGWQIRVVPNKYPIGEAHELIVETPQHGADLPDLPLEHLGDVVEAYRERLTALSEDERWEYVSLFKNHGRGAGATRIHPHSQMVGLPLVPPLIEEELRCARRFYDRERRCPYCHTLAEELARGERVVFRNGEMVVWSPYAARMSFECWILPLSHAADFRALAPSQAEALAEALQKALAAVRRVWPSPRPFAYNFYLHTAPTRPDPSVERAYHWHLEVLPRLGRLAGLEWGTGLYANPVPPEVAAEKLRAAL